MILPTRRDQCDGVYDKQAACWATIRRLALEKPNDPGKAKCIGELLAAIDKHIPDPKPVLRQADRRVAVGMVTEIP